MTDHAQPPEGVETWEIRNVPVKYLNAVGENADGELHLVSGRHPPLGESFMAVSLSAFLGERKAREQAERDLDEALDATEDSALLAAVARAEQAEAERDEARKMLGECYRLSGADPDGNDWPHLWRDAVEAVRELRKDYDDAGEDVS